MAPSKKVIDAGEVSGYRRLYWSWSEIAKKLGIHINTLTNWRNNTGFVDPTVHVTDGQLDSITAGYAQKNRGEVSTRGHIRSLGVTVTRNRLRASINRTDYEGRQLRKQKAIKRREYVVAGPHHVWHIDGHHKLNKYGLVTHACVDGFSRAVIYIMCCDNNFATTPLTLFKRGCAEYMIPSRVRGDRGGENVGVADFMIHARGPDRASFTPGPSKHNTRIERLWRDVMSNTIDFYKELFRELEEEGLNPDDALHVYVLQYMFLCRINEELRQFQESWNHHPVRTEKNRSPYQLLDGNRDLYPEVAADAQEEVAEGNFSIPVKCPLNDEQRVAFQAQCRQLTMQDSSDTLADKFVRALEAAQFLVAPNN
jgi:hypothetical protein